MLMSFASALSQERSFRMGSNKEGKQLKQTPFFARYLEQQEDVEPKDSASVVGKSQIAYKKAKPVSTLKYPSDRDELELYPYYATKAQVPPELAGKGKIVTLKYPSDNDEYALCAEYAEVADVPKGQTV